MNKFAIASLLAYTASTAEISTVADNESYIGSLDTQKLHQEVMDKVTKQVMEMNLKPLIDSEVQAQVNARINQKEAEDAWKFKRFTAKDWVDYDQKVIYEKIQQIMGDLEKKTTIDNLWQDASDEAKNSALRKFTIDFDLDTKEIKVHTKATDADGKPLFDWKLDPNAGTIDHIQRVPILNPKKIIADNKAAIAAQTPQAVTVTEQIAPVAAPVAAPIAAPVAVPTVVVPAAAPKEIIVTTPIKAQPEAPQVDAYTTVKPENMSDEEWAQLEEQRDLAYKIVYFFMVLIVATFGLLYVYYKMDQKEQQKEARQQREKGAFFGEIDKTTNFDFLGGQGESQKHEYRQSLNSTTFGQGLDNFDA